MPDMQFISTRDGGEKLDFEGVLLSGLARDGGLYLPATWPKFSAAEISAMAGKPYAEVAARIMQPFLGSFLPPERFAQICRDAYGRFDHVAVVPLKQLDADDWLMELFHGPTLAFKDVALQLLGRLFDEVLAKRKIHATILGATSGDTGSAAIDGCKGRDAIEIFMLHPKGRVSEVQRRQMTTVPDANVHNIAIEGTFDDCQALVKTLFNDLAFRDQMQLTAVNSINWARVMAQIVYYFTSAVALGAPERAVAYSVPTGNFGDIYAGYAARAMGLPISRLIVATNRNDILARFFGTGTYQSGRVEPTVSPSMDIQVSSNFERLIFDLEGRDGAAVAARMANFAQSGSLTIPADRLADARRLFLAQRVEEADTLAMIADTLKATGEVIDPHTAVGLAAARHHRAGIKGPLVTLATAHPAKFGDAVEKAIGCKPSLPARLSGLMQLPERCDTLPNDPMALRTFMLKRTRRG